MLRSRAVSPTVFVCSAGFQSVKPAVRPLTHEQYTQHVKLYLAPMTEREKDGQKVETYRPLPALGAIALAKLASPRRGVQE